MFSHVHDGCHLLNVCREASISFSRMSCPFRRNDFNLKLEGNAMHASCMCCVCSCVLLSYCAVGMHLSKLVCMCACVRVCVNVCVCLCVCVCVCVRVRA